LSAAHRLSRRDLNAATGILGIFLLGIFLTWFPIAVLRIPLPAHPVDRTAVTAVWQTVAVIVMPYVWAHARLGRSPAKLGLTRRNLGRSVLWGCALYALALIAFYYSRHDPLMVNHPIRHVSVSRALLLGATMCLIAAGTDIATRGFVLLSLVEHTSVGFAVVMQNVFWLIGHTHEIQVLSSALGQWGAVGLFLVLGVLGDTIVLRTRNVVGLAVAHILLNIVLITFIRAP
jgi:hypothetical protein